MSILTYQELMLPKLKYYIPIYCFNHYPLGAMCLGTLVLDTNAIGQAPYQQNDAFLQSQSQIP